MPKEKMERRAADNVYLHKDFHGALSEGVTYLHHTFGAEAVIEYLERFTQQYYLPLINDIKSRGLDALAAYFTALYKKEGGKITIEQTEDTLLLTVTACPAVVHMRETDYTVADLFIELERTVNGVIARESGLDYELLSYDPESGASRQRFGRRKI